MTTPRATYRFQLRAEFGLDDAAAQLDYLARLGISHAYLSPPLQAAAGSAHGYDGVDPTRVSDELGGEAARQRFVEQMRRAGLGQVIDIVPNHLTTADPRNRWWWDVLREGRNSRYASHFDIDWDAADPCVTGKVVVPILGSSLEEELEAGSISIGKHDGEGVVEYDHHRFPLAPNTGDGSAKEVLSQQNYLLTHWRDGLTMLTHRRFFDVTTLVGVRVEDDAVFDDVHRTVLGWVAAGEVDGLRVDHPDGLADPTGYAQRLASQAPDVWLVVEKILEPGEELRADWPVAGTTGYDVLNTIGGLFVDPRAEQALTDVYASITGGTKDFATVARRSRLEVVNTLLLPELERVSVRAARVLGVPVDAMRAVVAAFVAELPVYRTYVRPGDEPSAEDRAAAAEAVSRIATHHPDIDAALAAQLASVVLELGSDPSAGEDAHDLVRQIQQLSGPAMAKGVEDTAFYRYTRFVAVNEVGGDPAHFSIGLADFHEANARRAERWPATMVATSTHDTKRSEDVRARLAVLSEIPDEWTAVLTRWCERSGAWWRANAEHVARDPNLEVLLHQTLVGAHPLSAERAHPYLDKAMREAKNVTSWIDPDEAFESVAHGLLDHLLTDVAHRRELDALVLSIRVPGRTNALAQKLIALTVPGVPDVYQGTELWSLDLVDPDNRRPVDYALRRELLDRLSCEDVHVKQSLLHPDDPGLAKLHVVQRALDVRRRHQPAFTGPAATYTPLTAEGLAADCVVAFRRGDGEDAVITIAPRLSWRSTLDGGWRDTTIDLPPGPWYDVLSGVGLPGGVTALTTLTDAFPMALLERGMTPSLWAPRGERVELLCGDGPVPMTRDDHGWWHPEPIDVGGEYWFVVDGDRLPDPRSPAQPEGLDGPSHPDRPGAFEWSDTRWRGTPLRGAVIYEMHVGTFTGEGTFDSAIERLDHVRDLGATAVEVMPINTFPGRWGWGYDGALLYAPQWSYGGPDAFRRFVDACHVRALAVVLDVVYNHLGPSGNHLARFGPYFTDAHHTPWGDGINLDGPSSDEVRRFVVDNAVHWVRDFHVDGLRLDAVHALTDHSATHILEELAREVRQAASREGRTAFVIGESDLNDPRLVTPVARGGLELDAVWSDDFHHALHVAVTGETDGYYADYQGWPDVARCLERVFVFDGVYSPSRDRRHGRVVGATPRSCFLGYSQTHDQVGNRAIGERLCHLVDSRRSQMAAALVLTSPFTPMLFQGEEWAATAPFQYFTDHRDPELAEAVREGRRKEFGSFATFAGQEVPDPQDEETFRRSTLEWSELDDAPHAEVLAWYRALLALRATSPDLRSDGAEDTVAKYDAASSTLRLRRGRSQVICNVGDDVASITVEPGRVALANGDVTVDSGTLTLPAWTIAILVPERV